MKFIFPLYKHWCQAVIIAARSNRLIIKYGSIYLIVGIDWKLWLPKDTQKWPCNMVVLNSRDGFHKNEPRKQPWNNITTKTVHKCIGTTRRRSRNFQREGHTLTSTSLLYNIRIARIQTILYYVAKLHFREASMACPHLKNTISEIESGAFWEKKQSEYVSICWLFS